MCGDQNQNRHGPTSSVGDLKMPRILPFDDQPLRNMIWYPAGCTTMNLASYALRIKDSTVYIT